MYQQVLKPVVISVLGSNSPAISSTVNYNLTANENITIGCVNVNKGTVSAINGHQFDILWNSTGIDTVEVVVFNDILAKDTFRFAVQINNNNAVALLQGFLENIELSPNPTDGPILIEFESSHRQLRTNVYSLTGQLLQTLETYNSRQIAFQIEQPAGIYLIEVVDLKNKKAGFVVVVK